MNVSFAVLYNDNVGARDKNQRTESRIAISKLLSAIGVESTRRRIGADRSAWIGVSFAELRKAFATKGWIHPSDEVPEAERCQLDDMYDEVSTEVDDEPASDLLAEILEPATVAPEPAAAAQKPEDEYFATLLAEIFSDEPAAPEPAAVDEFTATPEPAAVDDEPATVYIDYAELMAEILADLDG